MIETFNPFDTRVTFYVILNAFFCIATACWIIGIFITRRYLFVKPSMLLLAFSHLFFQCPVALYAGYYENYLPDPYAFAFLIHAYMITGLLIAVFTFHRSARVVWDRITEPHFLDRAVSTRAVVIFVVLVTCVVAAYLSYVPLKSTGLYAIFKTPSMAAEARENSLKLLDSQLLKYTYSLMVSSVAPLLAVMLGILLMRSVKKRDFLSLPISVILLVFLAFAVSMPGARISAVNLLIVISIAYLIHKGIPFKPLKIIILIFIIMLPPAILSMLREGKVVGFGLLYEYLGYLVRRTFIVPLDVASWYVHYSQINGAFGIASLPKLASILGLAPLDVPNIIGLMYSDGSQITSTTAGAGYLFTYYSYFGLLSLLLSVIGLLLIDIALLVYQRLSDEMILPCIAGISLSILSFISSDYTVVWLTHGFGVILLLSLLLDRLTVFQKSKYPFITD